jgi:hypothetical protein
MKIWDLFDLGLRISDLTGFQHATRNPKPGARNSQHATDTGNLKKRNFKGIKISYELKPFTN